MSDLPEPECEGGYTYRQIVEILGAWTDDFGDFMYGQTMMICEGQKYNHDTQEYEEACGGVAHGMPIVYPWDLERYLDGRPIID